MFTFLTFKKLFTVNFDINISMYIQLYIYQTEWFGLLHRKRSCVLEIKWRTNNKLTSWSGITWADFCRLLAYQTCYPLFSIFKHMKASQQTNNLWYCFLSWLQTSIVLTLSKYKRKTDELIGSYCMQLKSVRCLWMGWEESRPFLASSRSRKVWQKLDFLPASKT